MVTRSPEHAASDIFVVMGAAVWPGGVASPTLRRRTLHALALAADRPARRFLVSGGEGRHAPAEAHVMRGLLLEAGVPDAEIVVEDRSTDTLDSVRNCAALLEVEVPVASVTVVSSGYHVPRCRLLFRLRGVETRSGAVPDGRDVLGLRSWLHQVLREVAALPWDALLMLLSRRPRRR